CRSWGSRTGARAPGPDVAPGSERLTPPPTAPRDRPGLSLPVRRRPGRPRGSNRADSPKTVRRASCERTRALINHGSGLPRRLPGRTAGDAGLAPEPETIPDAG